MTWVEVPDHVGVIVACRAWRWRLPGEAPLRAIAKGAGWPPLRRLEASCLEPRPWGAMGRLRRPPPTHPAPHVDCECGIWGLASPEALLREHAAREYVYGVVALWGAVVVGQRGWRAQYAYPQALVRVEVPVPESRAVWLQARAATIEPAGPPPLEELAAVYRVPVLENWPALTPIPVAPTGP